MKTLEQLDELWNELSTIEYDDYFGLEKPFLHFEKGTEKEEVWHWFEDQNKDFFVHKKLYLNT